MKKIDKIYNQIKAKSKRPIENESLVRFYLKKSLSGKKITFYDFECPPRFLDKKSQDKEFINYLVDLDNIFQNKKIDKFTEIPRIIKNQEQEKNILKFLISLGINFQFVKIIVDTNPKYITPESIKILGKKPIEEKLSEFKTKIREQTKNYPKPVKIVLFSELIKPLQRQYENSFKKALKLLGANKLIPQSIWNQQLNRTQRHIGLKKQERIMEFSKRTVASYAAEGIVFELLSKTERFPNCIWLNTAEADKRTIEITNCLRANKGISKLPMIFLKGQ